MSPRPTCLPALFLCVACHAAGAQPAALGSTSDGLLDLRAMVEGYEVDDGSLRSFYQVPVSERRLQRLDTFDRAWAERLDEVEFADLDTQARIDHVLLRLHVEQNQALRATEREHLARSAELLPFAAEIVALEEARWRLAPVDASAAADRLAALAKEVEAVRERVEAGLEAKKKTDRMDGDVDGDAEGDAEGEGEDSSSDLPEGGDRASDTAESDETTPIVVDAVLARRTAGQLDAVRRALRTWRDHYAAYEPSFGWWTDEPYEQLTEEIESYRKTLREKVAKQTGDDDDPILGDPIGRDALLRDLRHEMIPYSPEQLLRIGEEQLAWCTEQMLVAARELGDGDDWHAALARVKALHVPPGGQDALVVSQALAAVAFLEEHDLVTVPELCAETWRITMLDEQRQRFLPFAAYGGQEMLVAYPTEGMDHESKLESMRGNNIHFSRIVTPHELIPGHHLQSYMAQRHRPYRAMFHTPFLGEGWALYWEMRLWELEWAQSPENRIGMLFWRMHRAARIVVSLRFHLGVMDPDEMIEFLIDRVGHERDGATSEVRRYVSGGYGPLYQCAYMLGGLQLRALHREMVESGRMTEREFHDAVLRQGPIPVELIRAALRDEPPAKEHVAQWRFLGDVEPVVVEVGDGDGDGDGDGGPAESGEG